MLTYKITFRFQEIIDTDRVQGYSHPRRLFVVIFNFHPEIKRLF